MEYRGDFGVRKGVGGGWTTLLKVLAWLLFTAIVVGAIIVGTLSRDTLITILCIVGGIIVGFLSIAALMVYLNLARNTEQAATNTAAIYYALKPGSTSGFDVPPDDFLRCPSCGKTSPSGSVFCVHCGTRF
ncbi:MAG: hypothetical protein Q4C01_05275 [Clostridia bacterium]|nr:hypothetical protein [Clostridia bacterium]